MLKPNQKILEVGSGNLRNVTRLLNEFKTDMIFCYDFPQTYARFKDEYSFFEKNGGKYYNFGQSQMKFDVIICTYVMETFCPSLERLNFLKSIYGILKGDGFLIGSFRGYKGIVGSNYKECPLREGYISPLKTFVRPHSIVEVTDFLKDGGFNKVEFLEKYKVEKPQNIHLLAWKNG
jgi:SAM-dependent methyltransferase